MQNAALETLLRHDGQVPRYTSYPPTPFFTREAADSEFENILHASDRNGPRNLSFYFHVPFCPHRCLFCGCHTEIGRSGRFISGYMDSMFRELELLLPWIDEARPVSQVHFGGGTPNAAPYPLLHRLIGRLRSRFGFLPDAEVAIECDPNLITVDRLGDLAAAGFNRVSFGIQDFDRKVLAAVERRFPKVAPAELFLSAKEFGFSGNNLDLIYGLPFQTPETFRATISAAIEARPDRISLFPYAHVPWTKGHQSALDPLPRPDAHARLEIALESRETLLGAGFEAIGMDHFALPEDRLSKAKREGRLHRNFQGYCEADRAGQVHALGASGVSQLHAGYLQNIKDLDRYLAVVASGRLPFELGYRLRPEDQAVRALINDLLCRGEADVDETLDVPGLEPGWKMEYLEDCERRLRPLQDDGLVLVEGSRMRLTERGAWVARTVAAAMDPLHRTGGDQPRYSRAI